MDDGNPEYSSSKRSKFRFKSKSASKERHTDDIASGDGHQHRHRHRRRRHHHRRGKRQANPGSEPESGPPPLSPNAAFRESLFDALADDEGAAYWEGVYGQPIHTYPPPGGQASASGELESMTDEEYAAYVRARMWEKTHQGLLEERERQRQAREKQREEKEGARKAESEREAFERMIDDSLRRGQERQTKKRKITVWTDVWKRYLESWEKLNTLAREASSASSAADSANSKTGTPRLRNLLVWPVESGKREDITTQTVREFIRNAPTLTAPSRTVGQSSSTSSATDFLNTLKVERVRWHPDKMRHRYGMLGMEDKLVRSVTEVFQILDQIWVEARAEVDDR